MKKRFCNSVVYKIVNIVTKDCYIGSTINFVDREWWHKRDLNRNVHHSPILQNAWNKYGGTKFVFKVVSFVPDKTNLIRLEQYWIDKLKPKYNCSPTAGSPLGVKHTEQSRINMSKAHLGKSVKAMHQNNCKCFVCAPKMGKYHPRFIRRVNQVCKCGCKKSFTVPSNSKRKYLNGHNKAYTKPVKQLTLNNKIVKNWNSIAEAARNTKFPADSISRILRLNKNLYNGFRWEYA